MSLSKKDRIEDVLKAFRLMMQELGDAECDALHVDGNEPPYSELERTTWDELTGRGWLKDHGLKRFQFTGRGWREGVKVLKLTDEPSFAAKMSQLSKTLRSYVTPRPEQDVIVDIFTVITDSGLDHGFIYNTICTSLLDDTYSIKGAYMDPGDQNYHTIIIPKGYGLRPLPL